MPFQMSSVTSQHIVPLHLICWCRRHVEQIRKCWNQSKQLQEKRGAEQWALNFQDEEGKETQEMLEDEPRQQGDREGQLQNKRQEPPPQNENPIRCNSARIQRPPD